MAFGWERLLSLPVKGKLIIEPETFNLTWLTVNV